MVSDLKRLSVVLLVVFIILAQMPFTASGDVRPSQGCPTYLTNLLVVIVDSVPRDVPPYTTVVTTFKVIYPDGTPVTLDPETASFTWVNEAGESKIFKDVPVVPTGEPGFYTYTQTVTPDFPTGTVTISVAYCSCSDAQMNYGPTDDENSVTTIYEPDISIVQIGPSTMPSPPPTGAELLSTYLVPILIALLLIIALILLAARARKKKQ